MAHLAKLQEYRHLDMNSIRGILVDIDDTLYDYNSAHNLAISRCYTNFKNVAVTDLSEPDFLKKYRNHRNAVTARLKGQGACRSRLLAFQALFEELQIPKSYVLAETFEALYWNTLIENMSPHTDFIEWLFNQKNQGISICAVTDMQTLIQIRKIEALGLSELIEYLVSSEEVGHEKPHANMFLSALRKLNVSAAQTIMFGDSKTKDIEGAEEIGIRSCQITKYL